MGRGPGWRWDAAASKASFGPLQPAAAPPILCLSRVDPGGVVRRAGAEAGDYHRRRGWRNFWCTFRITPPVADGSRPDRKGPRRRRRRRRAEPRVRHAAGGRPWRLNQQPAVVANVLSRDAARTGHGLLRRDAPTTW